MNVLIVGAGMYVTGRGESGVGTILSSLIQTSKEQNISNITIAAKSDNSGMVAEVARKINTRLKTKIEIQYVSLASIDLDELCREGSFDFAIVSTPDQLHFRQIKTLLRNNIHVLSVKPLVSTVKENRELVSLQKKHELLGVVEFHKRYDEANLYTKKIISKGLLGKVLYYDVNYSQKIKIPSETFKVWVEHTNIFQYLGVHYVDLFYFMTEFKPKKLMAFGTKGKLKSMAIDAYDSIHVSIVWQDSKGEESITILNTSWVDPNCTSALSDQKYKIIGTEGRIENDHKNRGIEFVSNDSNILHPNPYFSEYTLDANGDWQFCGYGFKSIRQFVIDVASVLNGTHLAEEFESTRPTFSQALVSTSIIEAVNKSLDNESRWELVDA
ncbi:MAG: Gfo/Idh/MocA family oxidoreductase [Gammaproteobacteria bacterium]